MRKEQKQIPTDLTICVDGPSGDQCGGVDRRAADGKADLDDVDDVVLEVDEVGRKPGERRDRPSMSDTAKMKRINRVK